MIQYFRYTAIAVFSLFFVFTAAAQNNDSPETTSFKVSGVCGMCQHRIEKSLAVKGVKKAKWDVNSQMLSLTYEPSVISLDDIHARIASVGHDTELKKATDKTYNALPECCLYRSNEVENHNTSALPQSNEPAVTGVVLAEDNKGNFTALAGATIAWLNTSKGTVSDNHGVFSLPLDEKVSSLVISYTGYRPDTIQVTDNSSLHVVMASDQQLNTITVTAIRKSMFVNTSGAFRTTTITSKELMKAACCNLSESFETNPSVDVSYSDAITGSKQIQLLGLSGNYTQLTVENLPGPRGIATPLGLNSIAGPWIESIQLSKGTGSVVNGFESIAGQINVELKKPESTDRLYANGYVNSMGRSDLNLNLSQQIGSRWSTGLLLHNNFLYSKPDFNKDGFRDLPAGNLFSAINRWKYDNNKGLMVQFGVKVLADDRTGGETAFSSGDKFSTDHYGMGIKTSRYEGFAKIGYVFPEKKYKSIGLQLSAFKHKQNAYFGLTPYNAEQSSFYSNLIFQSIIGNTAHKYRTGLSFSADRYDELYQVQAFGRKETVPGAFFEYTYTMNEKFNVVAGIRADHNNLYGWFTTPRLNLRYEPVAGTSIRASAGRGQRTANVFAENMGALVSARMVNIITSENGKAYGLNPEVSWNKGISVDQRFRLFTREAMLSLDFFRNDFTNQVVADMEDPRQLKFYNLTGKSYSNSFQSELSLMPVDKLDLRLAYRWFDVKTTYGNELLQKPFTAEHRAFANLGYALQGWKFDYTINYVGAKRIPSTTQNPVAYQLPVKSPDYITMNAQVSKSLGKARALELYIGGENLTNYFQKNIIVAPTQPFGEYFDASMIWGPVSGRLMYAGFRYRIK